MKMLNQIVGHLFYQNIQLAHDHKKIINFRITFIRLGKTFQLIIKKEDNSKKMNEIDMKINYVY